MNLDPRLVMVLSESATVNQNLRVAFFCLEKQVRERYNSWDVAREVQGRRFVTLHTREPGQGMGTPVCSRCGSQLRQSAEGVPLPCPSCTPFHDAAKTRTSAGDPPTAPAQSYRGRTFGNYTILDEISRGAMGVVYKARQHGLDRVVALKVLLAGEMATEAQVVRFQREAQAAARLHHPAIVPVHEVGSHEGKHYYTMDVVEGKNLGELIRAGEVSTRRALDIASEVAEALEHAHAEGVIHRDIKPGNIMIDGRGHVHILDFGLAKQLDSDTRFTRTGTTIGTPAYMPPEQASGESPRVDHRADIYSLGAVLYEMLTGQPPFTGDTMMNTLMRVMNEEPVPPKRLNPRIHRDIQTIVLKAMEKSPERRYPTMRALSDDIRRFIAGESISARPAGLLHRAWRSLKKHRSAVFAIVAIASIGLAAYATLQQMILNSSLRMDQALEGGRRGGSESDRTLTENEQPTFKTIFEDAFRDAKLDGRWLVEGGSWRAAGGRLEVASNDLAAIHTREKFSGRLIVTVDLSLTPGEEGPTPPPRTVGCFLGRDWRHSYRVLLGGRHGPRLALLNQREEVAELECPPLQPDTLYRLTIERLPIGVRVLVESEAGGVHRELTYNELNLPRDLEREFPVGLSVEGARVRVHKVVVQQEVPPLKLTALQAAGELFRDGSFFEASSRFGKIAEAYEGRFEGLAALLGAARCHAAEGRYKEAAAILQRLESLAAGIHHNDLLALLNDARLDLFFCSANLNNFPDAVKALRRIADSGGSVDEAWLWHFPKHLAGLLTNRAYDEALDLLRASIFGVGRQNLHAAAEGLQAPTLQETLSNRARELAEAFCNRNQPQKVRAVYDASPTPKLADSFARAAKQALRADQRDDALALLTFCSEQKMESPALTQATVELGNSLCAAGQHKRLAELYRADPEPQLGPVFLRAVTETTANGKLDDSFMLLQLTVRNFPAQSKNLFASEGQATRLGKAFIARGDVLQTIALHELFDPPPAIAAVVGLFTEAAQKALADKKPEDALRLLEHARIRFGVLQAGIAAAATQLVTLHAAEGAYDKVIADYLAYPNDTLAPAVAKAIGAAAEAGQLSNALDLFAHYARNRHPIPPDALRRLADGLAALFTNNPQDDATDDLINRYGRVHEVYDSPVARSTLVLALGDALVRAGHLQEALTQYEGAGDAEGLLRAACVATELGHYRNETDPAMGKTRWRALRDAAGDDADGRPLAAAAALFTNRASGSASAEFTQTVTRTGKLPDALTHYLIGLRLWTEGDTRASAEFTQAGAGPSTWFTPLARRARTAPPAAEEAKP